VFRRREFLFVDDRLSMDDSVLSAVSALIAIQSGDREAATYTLQYWSQVTATRLLLYHSFRSPVCSVSLVFAFTHVCTRNYPPGLGLGALRLGHNNNSAVNRSTMVPTFVICGNLSGDARGCSPALISRNLQKKGLFNSLRISLISSNLFSIRARGILFY
jgi:hypothetical protein